MADHADSFSETEAAPAPDTEEELIVLAADGKGVPMRRPLEEHADVHEYALRVWEPGGVYLTRSLLILLWGAMVGSLSWLTMAFTIYHRRRPVAVVSVLVPGKPRRSAAASVDPVRGRLTNERIIETSRRVGVPV